MIIMIVVGVLVLAIGGVGAFMFLGKKKSDPKADAAKADAAHAEGPIKPPVFLPMEPFTVNLNSEGGDQFLQATFTLQLGDEKQMELFKLYTPQIRSRLLILLSGKKAADIATVEGKAKLSEEIIALAKEPFTNGGPPQEVTGVFITSFVIQ
jgi:flagellar FliL protein